MVRMFTDDDCGRHLRAAGLRVTRPRVAVMQAVRAHPHADTDEVFRSTRARLPEVSQQTVYDVLSALTAAGLVRRIQPSGHVSRYESRIGDNHHHVICRTCGSIGDVDCAIGEAPCLTPSDDRGFVIDEAEVIYWGYCPDCIPEFNRPARFAPDAESTRPARFAPDAESTRPARFAPDAEPTR